MREIEFRAFIEYKNLDCGYPDYTLMLNVHSIDFVKGTLKAGNLNETYKIKDVKLLEYTGLKDKNGVKIFEGDVFIDEDGCIGIVKYSEQFAWFIIDWYESPRSKEPIDNDPLGDINIHNMEVIGNIYENPELLEVEDAK